MYVCISLSAPHFIHFAFGQLLRCAHNRIVNIMKVYIERNNMPIELIRFLTKYRLYWRWKLWSGYFRDRRVYASKVVPAYACSVTTSNYTLIVFFLIRFQMFAFLTTRLTCLLQHVSRVCYNMSHVFVVNIVYK